MGVLFLFVVFTGQTMVVQRKKMTDSIFDVLLFLRSFCVLVFIFLYQLLFFLEIY